MRAPKSATQREHRVPSNGVLRRSDEGGSRTDEAPSSGEVRRGERAASVTRAAKGTRLPKPTFLDVPGYDPAVLSFPSGEAPPDLLAVVAHGAGDSPEEQCRAWRETLGDRGVILCVAGPRVAVHSEGRYFPDHFALERIVLASLEAFGRSFPDIAKGPVLYAGYSQGATMGALMIVSHGSAFPRLALVEGGFDGWTLARSQRFESSGGKRVLFVCGTRHCKGRAESSAQTLRHAGVDTRVVSDLSAGHTYGGAVATALENSLDWLLRGP